MCLQNAIVLDRVCVVTTDQSDATATFIRVDPNEVCDCNVPTGTGMCIAFQAVCSPRNQSILFT